MSTPRAALPPVSAPTTPAVTTLPTPAGRDMIVWKHAVGGARVRHVEPHVPVRVRGDAVALDGGDDGSRRGGGGGVRL